MSALRPGSLVLQLRLALARVPPVAALAGVLLCASAVSWTMVVPRWIAQQRAPAPRVQDDARTPDVSGKAAQASANDARLRAFHATLGDVRRADASLQTIFDAGAQSHLELDKADYKLSYDKAGRFWTYAVQMPVTGRYEAIRGFAERVLVAMPYASLDEMDFRRKDIGKADLEARLRFTLHLEGPPDARAEGAR